METRDSFVFYRSWRKAISRLDPETQLMFINAVFDYAMDFIDPELDDNLMGYWELIKPNIDANTKKWRNGKKGGRKPEPVVKPVVKPQNKVVSYNVNDNVNVNVNDNDKGTPVEVADVLKFQGLKNFIEFRDSCKKETAWINGVVERYKKLHMTADKIPNLLNQFGLVQITRGVQGWETEKKFKEHFANWIPIHLSNEGKQNGKRVEEPIKLSKPKAGGYR